MLNSGSNQQFAINRLKHGSVRASGCNSPGLLDRSLKKILTSQNATSGTLSHFCG